jgi:hypothetical protein
LFACPGPDQRAPSGSAGSVSVTRAEPSAGRDFRNPLLGYAGSFFRRARHPNCRLARFLHVFIRRRREAWRREHPEVFFYERQTARAGEAGVELHALPPVPEGPEGEVGSRALARSG